ncbi:MAG: NADH-quinone oxidoreductase subunit G [Micromonosporaceae bacterium]|nr:NADH-quinone oxidoreductase subunit G [Micromonosporaceae bacterium]
MSERRERNDRLSTAAPEQAVVDGVHVTIDGIEVTVPKGTLLIRAAEQTGIAIPRFCDHPLLDPVGACRQCLVEVEGQRKPVASCTIPVADGMVVNTQLTSDVAKKAQEGMMEFLLINHPLDCPMCDKGGECPLQNQAMSAGRSESRFHDVKRTYPKPIGISTQILLDRERCVLCARCTRFSEQIAGDPFIELFERSALEQVAIYTDEPFESYFSGNTVQICPVGALTSADYRFRARPFDLVSTPSVAEHDASGAAIRVDHRRGKVMRRLSGEDPEFNEEWISDKDRFAFKYATAFDRLTAPMVRDPSTGELRKASWTEAFRVAASGLRRAREANGVGVLAGGRLTVEDAYAYQKFARVVLGTNDVDFRARPHSAEEAEFLGSRVVGQHPYRPPETMRHWAERPRMVSEGRHTGGVTYGDVENASAVLLVGLEPEEECPTLLLRLRKAARAHKPPVYAVAPFVTRGLEKCDGTLVMTGPGAETDVLDQMAARASDTSEAARPAATALREAGAVILVGERLAAVPGALSAVGRLAQASGARVAWVPRRAGDRGAVDVGCLPTLLPYGRMVDSASGRREIEAHWGLVGGTLPDQPGRDTAEMLVAAADGRLSALVVGGVDPADLPDPAAAERALDTVDFLVSLELRNSAAARRADVVFPVAPVVEKAGTFLNWEGRARGFEEVLRTGALSDGRVLDELAAELDAPIGVADPRRVRAELTALPDSTAPSPEPPTEYGAPPPQPESGQAVLATWHHLLDLGSLQDGDDYLAGTARTPVARLSAATAQEIVAASGGRVTVSTGTGSVTLPLAVTDMPDRVVWLPTNSPGSTVRRTLGVDAGALVRIAPATEAPAAETEV